MTQNEQIWSKTYTYRDSIPQREFTAKMLANQQQLTSNLKDTDDFIICESGSSGSVVARRLAENADVSVAAACLVFIIFMCIFYVVCLICTC